MSNLEVEPRERRFNKPFVLFLGTLLASGAVLTVALILHKLNSQVIQGTVGSAATIIGGGNLYLAIKARPKNPN